jgi:hypothetical protein
MARIILWIRMYDSVWGSHKHVSEMALNSLTFGYLFQHIGITAPWWKFLRTVLHGFCQKDNTFTVHLQYYMYALFTFMCYLHVHYIGFESKYHAIYKLFRSCVKLSSLYLLISVLLKFWCVYFPALFIGSLQRDVDVGSFERLGRNSCHISRTWMASVLCGSAHGCSASLPQQTCASRNHI